jgi:hypothetical protein
MMLRGLFSAPLFLSILRSNPEKWHWKWMEVCRTLQKGLALTGGESYTAFSMKKLSLLRWYVG